jgi:hypothetical protein
MSWWKKTGERLGGSGESAPAEKATPAPASWLRPEDPGNPTPLEVARHEGKGAVATWLEGTS